MVKKLFANVHISKAETSHGSHNYRYYSACQSNGTRFDSSGTVFFSTLSQLSTFGIVNEVCWNK